MITRKCSRLACGPGAAPAAPRADEEEPGGAAQGAGGEEAPARGREGPVGGPAEAAGAAEAGGLQVTRSQCYTRCTHSGGCCPPKVRRCITRGHGENPHTGLNLHWGLVWSGLLFESYFDNTMK